MSVQDKWFLTCPLSQCVMDVCYDEMYVSKFKSLQEDVLGDPFAFWPKETEGNFYMGKVMRSISSVYKMSL